MELVQRKVTIGSGFRKMRIKKATVQQQKKRGNETKFTTCLENIKWCRTTENLDRVWKHKSGEKEMDA